MAALVGVAHVTLLAGPVFLIRGLPGVVADLRLPLFLLVTSAWLACESAAALGQPQRVNLRGSRPWLELAIGLAILVVFWSSMVGATQIGAGGLGPSALFGAAVMLAGASLRCVSIRTLGRFFLNEVAVLPGQPLITRGLYGVVRHPSEAGTLCLALGTVIMWHSRLGLLALLIVLLPAVIRRTQLEDRMLRHHYPAAFAHYARDVGALIPRLRSVWSGTRGVA